MFRIPLSEPVISNVQDTAIGTGNISANPGFTDSNYLLSNTSICIDKGDTNTIYNDPPDVNNPLVAKYPAFGTLRSDIGAYGGKWSSVLLNSVFVDIKKHGMLTPNEFELQQNYPNPFNPSTVIKFSIPKNEFISLKVYNIEGKETSILINNFLSPGNYEFKFTADNMSSGLYFYSLETKNYSEIKKMIYLK